MKKWMIFLCGAALAWTFNSAVCSAIEGQSPVKSPSAGAKTKTIKKQATKIKKPPMNRAKTKGVKKQPINQLNPQPEPPKPSMKK